MRIISKRKNSEFEMNVDIKHIAILVLCIGLVFHGLPLESLVVIQAIFKFL